VYTFSLSFVLVERNFMNLQEISDQLRNERDRLDQAIAALEVTAPGRGRPPKVIGRIKRRVMSAAARKRISAAMKLRWAQRLGKSAPKKSTAPAKKAPVRKTMSPAARKKLSALAKARWAARKKAGATSL
jgi:hypothetical protein